MSVSECRVRHREPFPNEKKKESYLWPRMISLTQREKGEKKKGLGKVLNGGAPPPANEGREIISSEVEKGAE